MKKELLLLALAVTALFTIQHLRRPRTNPDDWSTLILQGSDSNFSSKIHDNDEWVLVDFWAPWCGSCVRLKDELNELAPLYENQITFLAMNVDQTPNTTAFFGIRPIPALVLLHNGSEVDRWTGFAPSNTLQHWLDGHLRDS